MKIKPFLKWAGGKSQLLPEICKRYPSTLGTSICKYAEPFVGAGAVLFDVLRSFQLEAVYISDMNAELINTYCVLQNDAEPLIQMLQTMQDSFIPLADAERRIYYNFKRARFNQLKRYTAHSCELAALFIFLNRTCFNGLYRVNDKGEYNVPMGAYKCPLICDAENLRNVSTALAGVTIVHGDYSASKAFLDSSTFMYIDPPYRPLSITSNFTSYTEGGFNDEAQIRLAHFVLQCVQQGVSVLVSNSDPKNTAPTDEFFDVLYKPLSIDRISATRMINSSASDRGPITELLMYNPATSIRRT